MSREGIMSRRKTVWIVLVVALVALTAAVVLAACGSSGSSSTSSSASSGTGATKTLTIGVLMPFSGDGALWGKTELASIEVACEQINAAGGVKAGNDTYMLATKAYDHQWDPAVAATTARKAVQDGIRYIVSWSGPEVLAENAAERGNTVVTFVTAPDMICQGPKHPDNFMSWFYYPDSMQVLYGYARQAHPEYKTVAAIVTDDSEGLQEAKDIKQYVAPLGFEVLDPVTITGKETDFYPVLTPLLKKGVDIIDVGSPGPEDVGLIIKQARELGYKGTFAMADAPNIAEYADIAGWPAVEGFLGSPEYSKLTTPKGIAWQKAYKAKTQGDTATSPTFDYDSILLLAAAIEKAGTVDAAKVRDTLPTVTVEGAKGPVKFGGAEVLGIPHLMEMPINVVEVQNGKVVDVYNAWPPRIAATMSPSPSPAQ
jgi:branched-chain amino acid transport system substrate-binding protein